MAEQNKAPIKATITQVVDGAESNISMGLRLWGELGIPRSPTWCSVCQPGSTIGFAAQIWLEMSGDGVAVTTPLASLLGKQEGEPLDVELILLE